MGYKAPYWVHGYGKLICSECGYIVDEDEGMERYLHYFKFKDVCPQCGADMREPLKRCYYKDYALTGFISCGDVRYRGGEPYCYRQTRERTQELISWGCYYKCEGFKPKEPDIEQLTLW